MQCDVNPAFAVVAIPRPKRTLHSGFRHSRSLRSRRQRAGLLCPSRMGGPFIWLPRSRHHLRLRKPPLYRAEHRDRRLHRSARRTGSLEEARRLARFRAGHGRHREGESHPIRPPQMLSASAASIALQVGRPSRARRRWRGGGRSEQDKSAARFCWRPTSATDVSTRPAMLSKP